ncbi:MAG TPA: hypothetical protein EYP24_02490 [bacterium (Candidatus Stahlbacteria)]|nr:hypothetical protein [Candidatus Stahlbacteria bacterium]
MYLLMRFAEFILPFLPSGLYDPLALLFGIIFYYIRGKQRRVVFKNLRFIFHNQDVPNWILKRMVWQTYRNFAIVFLDTIRIPLLKNGDFKNIFEDQVSINLKKALTLNRGVVLISLHLGNWDLAATLLGYLKFPIVVVTERLKKRYLDFFNKRRARTGVETVMTDETLKMARALHENKVVVLVSDRDPTGSGEIVRFLGGKRRIPLGPVRLAMKFKAPVIFGYLSLYHPTRYLGWAEPHIFFGPDLEEGRNLMIKMMEKAIRRYPDQWFVFEDEWIE